MKKIIITLMALSSMAMATEYIVNQKGKQFMPNKLHVKVGDKVVFKNSDPFAHNAYSDDEGNIFDIGMQAPNEDKVVTIENKGTMNVGCNIHPNMSLTIIAE
jgi:plastocyanin